MGVAQRVLSVARVAQASAAEISVAMRSDWAGTVEMAAQAVAEVTEAEVAAAIRPQLRASTVTSRVRRQEIASTMGLPVLAERRQATKAGMAPQESISRIDWLAASYVAYCVCTMWLTARLGHSRCSTAPDGISGFISEGTRPLMAFWRKQLSLLLVDQQAVSSLCVLW